MSCTEESFSYNSDEPQLLIDWINDAVGLSKAGVAKIKHQFSKVKGAYNCYLFKLCGQYRYIFITNHKLNFSAMENEYGKRLGVRCIEGALFDLRSFKFVSFCESKEDAFYKFVIYDGGIPHIVLKKRDNTYSIMYIFPNKKEGYGFLQTDDISLTITHLNYAQKHGKAKLTRTRVLFYKKGEKRRFVVLDGLYLAKKVKGAEFHECVVPSQSQDEVTRTYLRERCKESGSSAFVVEGNGEYDIRVIDAFIIGGDSFVVTQDDSGLYGDKVFLLLRDDISYKRSHSFFEYKVSDNYNGKNKGHLIVNGTLSANDFDNKDFVFDATTREVIKEK